MDQRFHDSASAYRLHRSVTNEAEAIAAAIWRYVANAFSLVRSHLRLLDAGTGDGQVLKGVLEKILQAHNHRSCEVVLKEYDFHHIEVLLQNVAPMLQAFPRLALFVTNRRFRDLQRFPADLCEENTVCFDDVAGYRMLAMLGTSSILSQDDSPLHALPQLSEQQQRGAESFPFPLPQSQLWNAEQASFLHESFDAAEPALKALGDEIRAREIYDELAAVGGEGTHFTVTVTRQENAPPPFLPPREFFWDLAIVSHAFNRDKDPTWICQHILNPLCQGLSVGGMLVNVHATDDGQLGELKREIFADAFPFRVFPPVLVSAMQAVLDGEAFQVLPSQEFVYHGHVTTETFARLELWERELVLQQMATSVAYHLQIPDDAWSPYREALQAKIHELLERDGRLSYGLSIVGVKRRE
jgi:hypothetical protein